MAGVLKSLVGLSASVYTSVYVAAFRPDALSFLLIIAVVPTALGLCAMPFFNALPDAAAADGDGNAKSIGAGIPLRPQASDIGILLSSSDGLRLRLLVAPKALFLCAWAGFAVLVPIVPLLLLYGWCGEPPCLPCCPSQGL